MFFFFFSRVPLFTEDENRHIRTLLFDIIPESPPSHTSLRFIWLTELLNHGNTALDGGCGNSFYPPVTCAFTLLPDENNIQCVYIVHIHT